MNPGGAFDALLGALRGVPPDPRLWTAVIELANRSWLTPALLSAFTTSGRIDELPADVRQYLRFIHGRNRERNLRLRAQLQEAVAAFNRAGIRPILLKGAITLFTAPDSAIGNRMMSDLDLLIEEFDRATAEVSLTALGYRQAAGQHGLWRPQDPGVVELHARAGVIAEYGIGEVTACLLEQHRDGATALLPSPTLQALNLILHDQIKEGDYWRGCIDLRHLCDLAALSAMPGGIDWVYLRAALPGRLWRNALDTQALTLHGVLGVTIPLITRQRLIPKLQYQRRMAQIRHPRLAAPLRIAGATAWVLRRIRTKDRPEFTVTDILPRIWRKLRQGRRKAAEALMGVHLGPKL